MLLILTINLKTLNLFFFFQKTSFKCVLIIEEAYSFSFKLKTFFPHHLSLLIGSTFYLLVDCNLIEWDSEGGETVLMCPRESRWLTTSPSIVSYLHFAYW